MKTKNQKLIDTLFVIFFILAMLFFFVRCTKPDSQPENETPTVNIKYHLQYTAAQGKCYIIVKGNYENQNEYYLYKSWTQPIDTVITLPTGKVTKSSFEYATIYGGADAQLYVIINDENKKTLFPDSYGKMLYIYSTK